MHKRRGVTIIELIIAVAIIGLLASAAFSNYQNSRLRARDANRRLSVRSYTTSMESWKSAKGNYFVTLPKDTTGQTTECKPDALFKDGKGNVAGFIGTGDACVGYRGSGTGQITRIKTAVQKNYTESSIAQALQENGFLDRVTTDPLEKNYTDPSQRDFILTLCKANSGAATTPDEALHFSIFARLEQPSTLESSKAKVGCAGPNSPRGWDTSIYMTTQ